MPDSPTASIIILTYNNIKLTVGCLESIYARQTSAPGQPEIDFEVVVVDNASGDGSQQFLKEFSATKSNIRLILNETNLGFAAGNNLGAAVASGENLVFLNNDTIVTDGWLAGLLYPLRDPTVGMVGPVTNEIGNESCIPVDYKDLADMPAFAKRYTARHQGLKFDVDLLAFFCAAMRRSVYDEVGPLDEQFGVGMFEDDDYAMRLKQHSYRLVCIEDVFIHHHGSASFSTLDLSKYWYLFDLNRKIFETKWGIEWQPHLKRPELVRSQVRQMIDTTSWHVSLITKLREELDSDQRQLSEELTRRKNAELTLADIYNSNTWKLAHAFQKIRLALIPIGSWQERLLRAIGRPYRSFAKGIQRGLRWIADKQMSWYAYAFDRYKFNRSDIHTSRLDGIRDSGVKGLVSIVLPVYNGAAFIAEAVESILRQTYPNFELIVVDDGSSDETPRILAEFARRDQRVHILSQQNRRLPNALSYGFRSARGEFLTWTSDDNRLKPVFLEKLVDCLSRHPDWDMVYGNEDIINEHGEPLRGSTWFLHYQQPPGSEHVSLPGDPSELNVYPNNYIGAAFLYRKRVDTLLGDYSPRRFGAEDYDYWMRVNALFNLRHTDFQDNLYEYRFHNDSLTSRDEELGITRNRRRLMAFEDFRRDFYLTPLIWWIEPGTDSCAQELAQKIRAWVSNAGHLIYEESIFDQTKLPDWWTPIVYLNTSDHADKFLRPPATIPAEVLKVLIVQTDQPLPEMMDPAWDLCICLDSHTTLEINRQLPCLQRPRQGWLAVSEIPILCTALDIRSRSKQIEIIEQHIEDPSPPLYKATVIICTFHRGERLAASLRSVAEQTFLSDDFEIVVVNNDPTDRSADEIIDRMREENLQGLSERLKLVHCPFKGLSFARNAGIAVASGQLVCFLDDDAIAKPDWLEQIWNVFNENPKVGVVGGAIRLQIPYPRPAALKPGWEKFWSEYMPGYQKTTAVSNWWEFPWGANWCASRQALLDVGGFRSRYGRHGADFGGGEELVAASLIQNLGYSIMVNPLAEVLHQPDPSRFTYKHIWHTIRAGKRNQYLEQVDLYLPMEYGLRYYCYNQAVNTKSIFRSKIGFHQRIEYAYNSWIQFLLFVHWLNDRIARFRKPFVLR